MCTIGYCKEPGIIFKNRDKDVSNIINEEISFDNNIVACRTSKTNYFSWGMNKYGCSFVSAAVNTPLWTKLLSERKFGEAEKQYDHENYSLESPMILISERLSGVKYAEEWLEELKYSKALFKGYNLLVADPQNAYLVEIYKDQRVIRKLNKSEVVTNHFQTISHGPQQEEDYPSSFLRFQYGNEKIISISSLHDLTSMLKPEKLIDQKRIWREGAFKTVSSSIINFTQEKVCYAKNVDEDYTPFLFHNNIGESVTTDGSCKQYEMSRYIDLELYHSVERTHPYYVEMTEQIIEKIKEFCDPDKEYCILELGAGTGLLTQELLKHHFLKVTALELDIECCKIMEKHLQPGPRLEIVHGNAVTFNKEESYDIVVSCFAHDHIHYRDANELAKNIRRNLRDGGIYIMGGEILPFYSNTEEREHALNKYHGMIVEEALRKRHYQLAQIEIKALESGINMIGDFKRHEEVFELEMSEGGMKLVSKTKVGPSEPTDVGGVFVYTYIKH